LEAAKGRIAERRERGVASITVTSYLRDWKIRRLKEEQKVLATSSAEQVELLLKFRPKGTNFTRVHDLACLLLDTGLRMPRILLDVAVKCSGGALSIASRIVEASCCMKSLAKGCSMSEYCFRGAEWTY
jgi:hypothetical protein